MDVPRNPFTLLPKSCKLVSISSYSWMQNPAACTGHLGKAGKAESSLLFLMGESTERMSPLLAALSLFCSTYLWSLCLFYIIWTRCPVCHAGHFAGGGEFCRSEEMSFALVLLYLQWVFADRTCQVRVLLWCQNTLCLYWTQDLPATTRTNPGQDFICKGHKDQRISLMSVKQNYWGGVWTKVITSLQILPLFMLSTL